MFKIHGDITKPETIVITDEDYIQFVLAPQVLPWRAFSALVSLAAAARS